MGIWRCLRKQITVTATATYCYCAVVKTGCAIISDCSYSGSFVSSAASRPTADWHLPKSWPRFRRGSTWAQPGSAAWTQLETTLTTAATTTTNIVTSGTMGQSKRERREEKRLKNISSPELLGVLFCFLIRLNATHTHLPAEPTECYWTSAPRGTEWYYKNV